MKQFTFSPVENFYTKQCPNPLMKYEALDIKEAYYVFLEECLGITLSEYQKASVMRNLIAGNILFDVVDCNEVLQ